MKKRIADILRNTPFFYYLKKIYNFAIKIITFFRYIFKINNINKRCEEILKNSKYDIIDIFYYRFGWKAASFQRAQHIAVNMSKQNVLMFYAKNSVRDDKAGIFDKIADNLYLIDIDNPVLMYELLKNIKKYDNKKLFHTCSTNILLSLKTVKKFTRQDFTVLYEYIDEISPDISGKIPKGFYKLHDYIINNKDCIVVSSAAELYNKVHKVRGDNNHIMACNGVAYEHWQIDENSFEKYTDIKKIADEGKPIIGYFGALAKWFNYEMYKTAALRRPQYNFVLIGWLYDDSFIKNGLDKLENIRFLGSKNYSVLNEYCTAFTVCTIPFIINDITLSTSPVKIYEYLAAGKPTVCTAMPECEKVKDVLIAHSAEEFIDLLDKAVSFSFDGSFKEGLRKTAKENTWENRVKDILKLIRS